MSVSLQNQENREDGGASAARAVKHAEFAPPYPHNSPNEKELDPLIVTYKSVNPPIVTDGKQDIPLPRSEEHLSLDLK